MISDYNQYEYSKEEWLRYFSKGAIIGMSIGYLFYGNVIGVILLMPYGFFYVNKKKSELIRDRKWRLNLEFRDGLLSVISALNAGYSIENAFEQASLDLKLMYETDSLIVIEFESIVNQIKMNVTIERVLEDFAIRTDIEDINMFSAVFSTAKRSGGDLIKILRNTGNSIGDKIEVKREIKTLIASKRFESKIMSIIPFTIILYLKLFSPGFLDPLYNNIIGFIIMSCLLIIYVFAYKISENIMNIEV
ncbi:MAG: hypothetical protein GX323_03030 [Clostridiales bacterium]|nr:hypothetical protein [Clostridiales bacterium]